MAASTIAVRPKSATSQVLKRRGARAVAKMASKVWIVETAWAGSAARIASRTSGAAAAASPSVQARNARNGQRSSFWPIGR